MIIKSKKRKNVLQLVEKLKPPFIDHNADLKKLFYIEQAKKYKQSIKNISPKD